MLATGDSDFGPVFRRLRELGKGVVGVGPSSVLSSSVELSCHDYVFTDERSGKGCGRGTNGGGGARSSKYAAGSGRGAAHAGTGGGNGAGVKTLATRGVMAPAPPQLLSARGGFRFRQQHTPEATPPPTRACSAGSEGRRATSPLLLDSPAMTPGFDSSASTLRCDSPASTTRFESPASRLRIEAAESRLRFDTPESRLHSEAPLSRLRFEEPASETPALPARDGEVAAGWMTHVATTPSAKPSPHPGGGAAAVSAAATSDLSAAVSRVAVADEGSATAEPVLAPGQLLLPSMVTSAVPGPAIAAGAEYYRAPVLSPPPTPRPNVNVSTEGGVAEGGASFSGRLSPPRGSALDAGVRGGGGVSGRGDDGVGVGGDSGGDGGGGGGGGGADSFFLMAVNY